MKKFSLVSVITLIAVSLVATAAPNNRNQQVIDDRDKMENDDHWIYNDLERATQSARTTGKPMMVVFRCIP